MLDYLRHEIESVDGMDRPVLFATGLGHANNIVPVCVEGASGDGIVYVNLDVPEGVPQFGKAGDRSVVDEVMQRLPWWMHQNDGPGKCKICGLACKVWSNA